MASYLWYLLTVITSSIVVIIILFLAFRNFMLWYWKLDQIEKHLKGILDFMERDKKFEQSKEILSVPPVSGEDKRSA